MKYLTFFSTEAEGDLQLATSPAGVNKGRYIAQLLQETGHSVEIVSPAWSKCGRWRYWKAFDQPLDERITLHQLATFGTPLRWLTPLQWVHSLLQLFFYLLLHTQAGEPVVVYHSYYASLPVLLAKRLKKFKLVLEVEEIYQDIVPLPRVIRRQEDRMFQQADGYIFSTVAIGERLHRDHIPSMVVNGAYRCDDTPHPSSFSDGKIHCLYSGTFDKSKAGAYLAVEAAAYLPDRYCVHISGFGTEEQTRALLEEIRKTQATAACDIVYEGFLDDSAYRQLLQKCQIGLNTQTPDQRFSNTCFPSKILVYMSHGLQVVSAANKAITASDVGDRLVYYPVQTPQAVAQAIQRADPARGAENARFVQQLHQQACRRVTELLAQI